MKLSVVIPAHNEEGSIGQTVSAVTGTLERETIDYEILVIDDASSDSTAAVVGQIAAANERGYRCRLTTAFDARVDRNSAAERLCIFY